MQSSIQRMVSDGTLQFIDLAIEYIDKVNVKVSVDDVPIGAPGSGTPYTYEWITDTRIKITPVVPLAGIVVLRRVTPTLKMYHVYDDGATFNDFTMDENFKQLLFIGQEAIDGGVATDFYTDVNIHGYRIKASADGIEPTDLVTVRQYQADAAGAYASAQLAEKWANYPKDAQVTPGKYSAYHWSEVAKTSIAGVQSFKGRAGVVVPEQDDYSSTMLSDSAQLVRQDSAHIVRQDSATGAAAIPVGTEAQRPVSPTNGQFRYNLDTNQFEGYQNGAWGQVGGSGSGSPLFSVMWWPSRVIPEGYIAADGQVLSRATYPDAWAGINAGNVPTVADATWNSTPTERGKFTVGDGSTTFRLPDYNGKFAGSLGAVFLRGDGALSAAVSGAIQQGAMQGHDHASRFNTAVADVGTTTTSVHAGSTGNGWGAMHTVATNLNTRLVAGPITDGVNGTPSVASETRPLNVTGCWVIKLFGAVVNVGSADAAQLASDYANLVGQINALQGSKLDVTDKRVCTAWVNFNGIGTAAIRDSYNVSSITDNGVGDFTINLASAMLSTNYSVVGTCGRQDDNVAPSLYLRSIPTASYFRVRTLYAGGSYQDFEFNNIHVFGGK